MASLSKCEKRMVAFAFPGYMENNIASCKARCEPVEPSFLCYADMRFASIVEYKVIHYTNPPKYVIKMLLLISTRTE